MPKAFTVEPLVTVEDDGEEARATESVLGGETVIMNVVGIAVFPTESDALQVTVLSPNAKVEPETGKQFAIPC
jgi:hypothetical protein